MHCGCTLSGRHCSLVFCTLQSISVSADLTTEEAEAAYKALTQSPAASIPVHTATTSDGSRFSIIGAADLTPPKPPVPNPTPTLAVKLWFELVNGDQPTGRFVNPEKHKFQKAERFRIWIDSATPITAAISQYFPDSGLGESRSIHHLSPTSRPMCSQFCCMETELVSQLSSCIKTSRL